MRHRAPTEHRFVPLMIIVIGMIVVASIALVVQQPRERPATVARYSPKDPWTLPLTKTPGAFDPMITKAQVCDGEAAGRPRHVTDAMKQQVLAAYGVTTSSWHGEFDHLVSRELGGTDVVANLWPEPGSIPNAKDRLENKLKALVCAGTITLAHARSVERTNWVAAYHTYVGS